jgi:hypothetical protein
MFVLEGLPSTLGVRLVVPRAGPSVAGSVALPAEREAIEARIEREQGDIKPGPHYGEALRSPTVVRMAVLYFLLGSACSASCCGSLHHQGGRSANIARTGWLSADHLFCEHLDADRVHDF